MVRDKLLLILAGLLAVGVFYGAGQLLGSETMQWAMLSLFFIVLALDNHRLRKKLKEREGEGPR